MSQQPMSESFKKKVDELADKLTYAPLGRYLEEAMKYQATFAGNGNCFQRTAALMMDMPGATLVFGMLPAANEQERNDIPNSSTAPMIHAWVEHRGKVYAPTLVERFSFRGVPILERDVYYATNRVMRVWRLESAEFAKIAKRLKLASALKHGKARFGHGDVTDALLTAAKLPYIVGPGRGVLPAPHLLESIRNGLDR